MQADLEEADKVEEDELDKYGDGDREREHVGRLRWGRGCALGRGRTFSFGRTTAGCGRRDLLFVRLASAGDLLENLVLVPLRMRPRPPRLLLLVDPLLLHLPRHGQRDRTLCRERHA